MLLTTAVTDPEEGAHAGSHTEGLNATSAVARSTMPAERQAAGTEWIAPINRS